MQSLSAEQRLEQLETQLAFQEDTINRLNQAITEQQQLLAKQQRQLELLANRLKEVHDSQIASASEETPPPHY